MIVNVPDLYKIKETTNIYLLVVSMDYRIKSDIVIIVLPDFYCIRVNVCFFNCV